LAPFYYGNFFFRIIRSVKSDYLREKFIENPKRDKIIYIGIILLLILNLYMVLSGLFVQKHRDPILTSLMDFPGVYIYVLRSFWKEKIKG